MTVEGNGTREGTKLQRETEGNQGTRKGGDSNRPRGQEYSGADQDVPVHIQSTVAPQTKIRIVSSTKKLYASAPKATGKTSKLDFYKGEYRKLRSENEDLRSNLDDFTTTLEEKDAEIDRINRFLSKTAVEFGELEEKYKKIQEDFKASQAESAQLKDSANKLTAEVEAKNAQIIKLTVDVDDHKELLGQAQQKNVQVESDSKSVTELSTKLQEKIKRFKEHYGSVTKEMEQVREENKQLLIARDNEIAAREGAEQKLAQVKSDLAKEMEDRQYYIVETESEDIKKMRELSSELDKMVKEVEDSKEALEKKQRENLQIMSDYQQLEDKMKDQVVEYEEKLKAKAENAEKCMTWSQIKATESENLQKQLNNTIDDLKAEMKAVKKENEEFKLSLQKEHQQCLNLVSEVTKLHGTNKQMESTISNKEAELTKLKMMITKLEETETSKLEIKKKHEEILLQSNVDKLTMEFKQATENYCVRLVQEIRDQEKKATEAFQSQLLESQHKIDELTKQLAVERSVTGNAKIELDNLRKQLQQLEKQKKAGYKEREDRIAELKKFIKDQITELDKMKAAMKQTVANKEMAEKELNETLEKKQAELIALQVSCNKKDKEINDRATELAAMKQTAANKEIIEKQLKSQLSQSQRELAVERSVTDNAKSEMDKLMGQLQQLQNDKRTVEQQMNAGYKEREDRIAELEEFINDQVTELDKMEAEMKQAVANKQILEENYQVQKAEMEQHINALQVQLEKALDPLENIEELKEVEDLGEEIGRGAYGLVKKVSVHGTICAAKDIHAILIHYASDKELERIKRSFLEECVKCSKLFHPNIVQFLGIHYPSKQAKLPWLVMELLDCNLAGFVKRYDKESVALFVKASIFYDISLGLQFLHGRDIIHRDLSSNNVLLTKHLTAKISDLGVAKLVDSSGTKSHTVVPGTQHFLPPEVISDAAKSHYGKPIDVFSLGCIMIHVTTHEWPTPLPETHYEPKLKKKVVLSEIERREAYLNQIQELPELKVLVENCLHDDPGLRPDATKMVEESGKLKILYQNKSSFAGSEMNAVEFEKRLKLQEKRISEQQSEIQKLNKTINKPLQDLS